MKIHTVKITESKVQTGNQNIIDNSKIKLYLFTTLIKLVQLLEVGLIEMYWSTFVF